MIDLGERLKKIRIFFKATQTDLANIIGASSPTIIGNYENGLRKVPIDKLEDIAKYFNIPFYKFFIDDFDDYINSLKNDTSQNDNQENEMIRIPVVSKASAGNGVIVEEDISFYMSVPRSLWKNCDFATRVEGDSMSPLIEDGEIAFIHKQSYLDNGQIGIFYYNGEIYIKKYKYDVLKKEVELISINQKYDKILIEEGEDFNIIGKVLGNLNYSL